MDDSKASILFRCRIGFCILMAVAVIWATLGFFSGRSVSTALRDMDAATSLLRNQMDADGDRAAIRGGLMAMLAARGAPSIDAQAEGKETLARITELRLLMGKTQAFDGAPEVHAAAIAVNADIASYLETADAMTRQILSGQDVRPEQVERFRETFSKLDGGMSRISDKVEEHVRSTRETAEFAALVGIVSGLGCLALVCCSIYGVWRRVRVTAIVPMMAIGKSVERMSQDELEVVVPFTANGDEIGNLARAAERLRDKLLRADAAREEQERTIVSSLGEALSRMAAGDMTVHLDQNLGGVFERLRHDFNQAVSDLARTLRMVSDATGETLNTSREISASVSDLSARNEQQSASVESIAGSISGVTGRIVEAAQSAALAQTAVDEVNSEVTQGGQVISSAVDAMDRIEASSREIGNIISVIDGISFQTNLLALNAGVEAARAGEAGKGFAVVATEVRALAQRSADAANQIKDLITVSSGEVETGVRLVREAGASLQAIMVRMAEIAAIMEQLSAGASEQSSALTEIDRGTKGLEQITRSNAALAEEVSAATRQVVSATEEVSLKLSSLIFAAGPVGTSTRNAGFVRSRAA